MDGANCSAAWYTDIGKRAVNEDAAVFLKSDRLLAALVADGLGGMGGGDVASRAAADALQEEFDGLSPLSAEGIEALCRRMNQAVIREQTGGKGTKTTMAAAFYDGHAAIFAHVGDSRIYHVRKERILYQSTDHSVSQMAVLAEEIRPQDIRFHADRSKILHSLGEPEEVFRPDVEVSATPILPGDGILICSDGFWEPVLEKEMLGDYRRSKDAKEWLGYMRSRIRRKRLKDQDNNSAVVLMFR